MAERPVAGPGAWFLRMGVVQRQSVLGLRGGCPLDLPRWRSATVGGAPSLLEPT